MISSFYKKILCFVFLLLGINETVHPISVGAAQGISVAVGAATGAGIGLGMHYYGRFSPVISTIAGVFGGAAAGGIAYYLLYQYTPEGKMARANYKINRILSNPIAIHAYATEKEFFDALQGVYVVHDLWLISAFRQLSWLLQDAHDVLNLVSEIKAEASQDYTLMQQCNNIAPIAIAAIPNITKAIKTIRENKEYIEQLKLQKEQEMRERELQVAAQQASAAQTNAMAQMSMAHSQAQMVYVKQERNDIEGYKAAARIARL